MGLKKLVAGNWKMHGLTSDLEEIRAIAAATRDYPQVDVALCVPAILVEPGARAVPGFGIGGQRLRMLATGIGQLVDPVTLNAQLEIAGNWATGLPWSAARMKSSQMVAGVSPP